MLHKISVRVKWGPCYHSMARPQNAVGETGCICGVHLRQCWRSSRGHPTEGGLPTL